ncbi:hypothetical protein MOUN0_K06106, partial [Monosporozyma unispora]|nr:hypothetical protein C6P44_004468 [Kazachstania unispora]
MSKLEKKQVPDIDSNLVNPSIKQSIQGLLLEIDSTKDITNLKPNIVTVLNDSLNTISHLKLQNRLNHIDTGIDDRKEVENKLLRKELEILKLKLFELNCHKTIEKKKNTDNNNDNNKGELTSSLEFSPQSKSGKTRNNSIVWKYSTLSPVSSTSATSPSRKRSLMTFLQNSDQHSIESGLKTDSKDPPMGILEGGKSNSDVEDTDYLLQSFTASPTHLKLVENSKPHPRMRRTSDNPATNEYVRVFHLQKEK